MRMGQGITCTLKERFELSKEDPCVLCSTLLTIIDVFLLLWCCSSYGWWLSWKMSIIKDCDVRFHIHYTSHRWGWWGWGNWRWRWWWCPSIIDRRCISLNSKDLLWKGPKTCSPIKLCNVLHVNITGWSFMDEGTYIANEHHDVYGNRKLEFIFP